MTYLTDQTLKIYPQHENPPFIFDNKNFFIQLTETLSRQMHPAVFLHADVSQYYIEALIESFAHHLKIAEHRPKAFQHLQIIELKSELNPSDRAKVFSSECTLLIIAKPLYLQFSQQDLHALHRHPSIKLWVYGQELPLNQAEFSVIELPEPTTEQYLQILMNLKTNFEHYHLVSIADESLETALQGANLYLNANLSLLDRAINVLDSAASRASMPDSQETVSQPIVTPSIVNKVLSNLTQIPPQYLQPKSFQLNAMNAELSKKVQGQESAINLISLCLQHAKLKFQRKAKPLSFIFAGPENVGKGLMIKALAESLYGSQHAIFNIDCAHLNTCQSLTSLKGHFKDSTQRLSILAAVKERPFAIIVLKNFGDKSTQILSFLQNIFTSGYATHKHEKINFQHSLFVITTTLGAKNLESMQKHSEAQEANQNIDLLQLVLNERKAEPTQNQEPLSAQEMIELMLPELESAFPASVLQHLNVIPFTPLDYASLEKIMRQKLKTFATELHGQYGLELNYAPEVIRFLVHETLWRNSLNKSISKVLQQHLYSAVAHELLHLKENEHKRLLLQLNDAGQVLKCELMMPGDAMVYKF